MSKRVAFHFLPNIKSTGENAGTMTVKKSIDGKEGRYLEGVSSGLQEDAHKERMSEECIKGFMDQANSGDILLYPDIHGIKQSEDIGILEKAKILSNGDWWTSYRLYDDRDQIGSNKLEMVDTVWKQCQGAPPYTKPKQKGFSIEGLIYEDSIIEDSYGGKILNKIDLDGVVLVPRPAYVTSIAHSVYKALDELAPWRAEIIHKNLSGEFNNILQDQELKDKYWSKKYGLNDALEVAIDKIMSDKQDMKQERLSITFDEYKTAMTQLLMESQAIFRKDNLAENVELAVKADNNKNKVFKSMLLELNALQKIFARRIDNET